MGTKTNTNAKTVCCKLFYYFVAVKIFIHVMCLLCFPAKAAPFRLEFISNGFEMATDAAGGGKGPALRGAKLRYFQRSC